MKVTFKKTGYSYLNHWIPELRIYSGPDTLCVREISQTMGRETYKAAAIDKYILKKPFLESSEKSHTLVMDIRGQRLSLLKGMLQIKSPFFFRKALEEEWSLKQMKANVLFKIL